MQRLFPRSSIREEDEFESRKKRHRNGKEKNGETRTINLLALSVLRPFSRSFLFFPLKHRHLDHRPLSPLLLLRRQGDAQDPRQLRQDRRARDGLAGLVLLDDLRLLVDRLRERGLRHPFREPGLHDALLELGRDAGEGRRGEGGWSSEFFCLLFIFFV